MNFIALLKTLFNDFGIKKFQKYVQQQEKILFRDTSS
jgi:hypothetical protein